MRFKRRFFLFMSFAILSIYLCLYIFIPNNRAKSNLEDLYTHQKLFGIIQNKSNDIDLKNHENMESCTLQGSALNVDLSMYNLYKEIKFNNIDGGAWKQGWDIQVNKHRWNSNNKLKVFVVPHSHNDPGWKKTFEQYYTSQTKSIFNNMVSKLPLDFTRKFIWAEVSFLSLWWAEASDHDKEVFKTLLDKGQIEIVSGGWVMPDEANSHYYSIIQELTHGHQWLKKNLNYKPRRSWCIDPFGTSPTMPYLLQHFGLESLVIQRTHYAVKKYLAKHKQLEFRWRQFWDKSGKFDFMTHMMPFYSYDIPHTCGPDPSICCQFDFRRSYPSRMNCPWKKQPQIINERNLVERSSTLLDQYRKKAELYLTNVLLVPLGDDFRYDEATEWDLQYENYRILFDFMNKNPSWYVEVKFGTLEDYFNALEQEKTPQEFPSLSGDFFTYADRDDHYYSGYYTSRPYYKRMDRELVFQLRAADILFLLAWKSSPLKYSSWLLSEKFKFTTLLQSARASLSLFQHHDGITGTAKDYVVEDYARKLHRGMEGSQYVMQQSLNFLLSSDKVHYHPDQQQVYFDLAKSRKISLNDHKLELVKVSEDAPRRRIVIFNSLTWKRTEILSIKVESYANIELLDQHEKPVHYQISPFCDISDIGGHCFLLYFKVFVEPLSVVTLFLSYVEDTSNRNNLASVSILNDDDLMNEFQMSHSFPIGQVPSSDFSIENSKISVTFKPSGLMKAITLKKYGVTVQVHLSFVKYSCKNSKEMCGAYLFLPDGPGRELPCTKSRMTIIEGKLVSTVKVYCDFVVHTVHVYKESGSDEYVVEIQNLVDIKTKKSNFEIAMKLSTNIMNDGIFYTDLNGMQIIKRQYLSKLPLQANYYPMPTSIYIEDDRTRLTVLSAQPLGAASLNNGVIEIMQDRRLRQDDNLGLGQGVEDNRPVLHIFKVVIDKRIPSCRKTQETYPGGYLSVVSYLAMNSILYPLALFVRTNVGLDEDKLLISFSSGGAENSTSKSVDVHLVSVNTKPEESAFGIIFHRTDLDTCFHHEYDKYLFSDGRIKVNSYIPLNIRDQVHRSSLSFLHLKQKMNDNASDTICPMGFTAFLVKSSP